MEFDERCLILSSQNDVSCCFLQDYMRAVRVSNPRVQQLQSELDNDEVLRWVTTLTVARVTRWGGMISTPDAVLQAVIKRALLGECAVCVCGTVCVRVGEDGRRRWHPPQFISSEQRRKDLG